MRHSLTIYAFLFLMLGYIVFLHFKFEAKPTVGIVQMNEYVYEYQGMKEATEAYLKKINLWNSQSDSIKTKLKELYLEMQLDSISKDKIKLQQNHKKFEHMMYSYEKFQEQMEHNANEDDQKMTKGILNQLKGYMKEYATKEGYDVIISNSEVDNVGYVNEGMDITKELLKHANSKYNNEK
ncbi:MAG: OmpH family outer membrane protein [Bacteroidota bacterium]|nr:OmpH family outer membrane protein [Bacteroidota bacterium]